LNETKQRISVTKYRQHIDARGVKNKVAVEYQIHLFAKLQILFVGSCPKPPEHFFLFD
jgi:hypothetical protein